MISIRELKVVLGTFVLGRIDLDIAQGEYFVLLGPTGAGKSVLLETVAGLFSPAAGEIVIDGRDISTVAIHKRGLGVVFQEPHLFWHKRVVDNIGYALRIAGMSQREVAFRVDGIAEEVGAGHLLRQYPASLSGGERQRVALARTLVSGAKYLLLDEPLSAIDANGRAAMCQLLSALKRKYGLTVLHVTHDFQDALVLADRMGVMNAGRMVETGSPEELFVRPGSHFTAKFLSNDNVMSGDIVHDDGVSLFVTKHNNYILPPQAISGRAYLMIGSEHIVLSRESLASSARNCIPARVKNIISQPGGTARVEADAGDLLCATVLKRTVSAMDIKSGDKIYLAFKSSSVHVIGHCQEELVGQADAG